MSRQPYDRFVFLRYSYIRKSWAKVCLDTFDSSGWHSQADLHNLVQVLFAYQFCPIVVLSNRCFDDGSIVS